MYNTPKADLLLAFGCFLCYTLLNTYRRKEGVQRCKSMLSDRVRPLWKHFVPI